MIKIELTEGEARALIRVNHLGMAILAHREDRVEGLRDEIYSASIGPDVLSGIKKLCQAVNPVAAAIADMMTFGDCRDN